MSSLLREAIVDATALKEAALKNAEAAIIEKYSTEVKETLDKLLEQDLPDLGAEPSLSGPDLGGDAGMDTPPLDLLDDPMAPDLDAVGAGEDVEDVIDSGDVPLAAADGLPGIPGEGEVTEFNLDLGALQEAISELQTTLEENEEIDVDEEQIIEILAEDEGAPEVPTTTIDIEEEEPPALEEDAIDDVYASPTASLAAAAQQSADTKQMAALTQEEINIDIDDDLLSNIAEELIVDMKAELSGWAGRSSHDMQREMEKEFARRRSTDLQGNLDTLKLAQEEVVFENKQLKKQLTQYKQATTGLKENLQNVNLSNARLLYTNRVLRNTSLNERQKERIVEAISNAGSVTEARTIFDTLQSTVESTPRRGPQSLGEAITRNRSSVIRASRRESTSSDPISDRMKKLAGIK